MSAYHRTTAARAESRAARKLVVLPVQCWRCGGTIETGQRFEMGHTVDVAQGGAGSALAPEHWQCNRTAGGKLGGARKAAADRARRQRTIKPSW